MAKLWMELGWEEKNRLPLRGWRKVGEKLVYVKNEESGSVCGEIVRAYILYYNGKVYGKLTLQNVYGILINDKIKLVFFDDAVRVEKVIRCRNKKVCIEALNELMKKEEEKFKNEIDYCP